MTTQVQILYEAVCISHRTTTSRKPKTPTIIPSVMGKITGQIGNFSLVRATSLGEGKLQIQTC